MALHLPQNCRSAPACLNYGAFLFSLEQAWSPGAYAQLCRELRGLGRIRQEALGVTYVDGEWGFLIIPPPGFPELKINFYHGAHEPTAQAILDRISLLLADARSAAAPTATSEQM